MQRTAISLAVLALWASLSDTAVAQSETALPKVQVTGSHLSRVDAETATPTQVVTREDIRRSGATTVKELLDTLVGASQLQSGSNRSLSDITGSNSYAAGGSAISLRALGAQSTLVLLNSRRLAPFAMHDDPTMFTDLNGLPLDAVERIEILSSGGAAVYGSDAVAGVVNIITRKDYQGVSLRAGQERSTNTSAFRSTSVGLTAGFGDMAEQRFNVMVNAELYRRASVMWGDVLPNLNPKASRYSPGFGTPSTYSYPGNLFAADGSGGALAGCDPAKLADGLCMYDRYSRLEAVPASERANLLVSGRITLAPTVEGFGEALLSRVKTRYTMPFPAYGPPTFTSWYDPSTGQSRLFIERGLPKEHPLNPTGEDDTDFRYRFADSGSRQLVTATGYRVLGGLRGTFSGFDWEAAAGVMGSSVDNLQQGTGYSDSGFKTTIGDYNLPHDPLFFNRGYRIGQPNSPAVLNTLFPAFTENGRMKQAFIDGRIAGKVAQWNGRAVDAAVGFDLRHESFDMVPSANMLAGDIVGYGVAETRGKRLFGSVFAEANIPLAAKLDLQPAVRVDKYPGFGANLSPKVGLRFEASRSLLLRSTVEAGFRAPNLVESANTTLYSFDTGLVDPKRCPQASALAADLRAAADALPMGDAGKVPLYARADLVETQECGVGVPAVRRSNPDIKPEKSLGSTVGLVFEPVQGLSLTADYWRIDRRNEIGFKTPQALINSEDDQAPGVVERLSLGSDRSFTPAEQLMYGVTAGALSGTSGRFENSARTRTAGVDIGMRGRMRTPIGVFTTALQSSFLDEFYQFSAVRGGYGDNLAGRYGYPRWKAYLTGALDHDGFSNALRLNFTSQTRLQGDFYDQLYTDQGCADAGWSQSDCRVRRAITLDYAFAYTGVKGLTLGINVRNLLNTRPPVNLRALEELGGGIIPQNVEDAYRRTVRLSMAYRFF